MVKYTCLRCGYSNINKSIFIRHLKRKFICKPILDNISIDNIFEYYFGDKKITLNKMNPKESKRIQNESKNKNICTFCNKKYSTNSNLNKHLKKCKKKQDHQDYNDLKELVQLLNDELKEHRKEMKQKNKQINELIKKVGITTNIQNNIKVLAYKDTDLSHLTKNDYMYCLNRSNLCIPHLIKKIHFNPQKPENHNIYISNIKNNYIMIYDNNKWIIKDRDESINELINKNEFILEQKLEEWIENGKNYPEIMNKFNRYIDKKENDIILDKIKKEIQLILFNNRDMVIEV